MAPVQHRYGNLIHLSPDAILVYRHGRIVFANPAASALFGAAFTEELLGKSPLELLPPEDRAPVLDRIHRLLRGEPGVNRLELSIHRLDGTTRRVEANAATFEDDEGKAIEAVLRDVTDHRKAEEALHASEERLRAHIDNSPLAVVEFDPRFTVTRWSKEAEHVFGWTADEMIGRRISEVRWVHEEDEESVGRECARLLSGSGKRTVQRNRNYRKDGAVVHCEWYNSALHDSQGELISILSQVLDVTARERAEEELRSSEERFRTLADNIAALAWMADERGALCWYNRRWLEYTGTAIEEVRGSGWQKVVHPDHLARVVENVERCFRAGEPFEDTLPLRGRDGAYRWFLSRAIPIRDDGGRVVRWFGTDTDVTEQLEARRAVEDADRRKTEFLAVLSHEIRNDLAPIANGLRLLERTSPGSATFERAREIVRRQVEHVTSLVDDLLDISRISTGKIRLERTRFDAREVVRRECEDLRAAFEERGLALTLDVASEPLWVDADRTRLTQIVGNLLGNALKFTAAPGSVHVALRLDDAARVELCVRDTGVGIEPASLASLFEPFAQVEQPENRNRGGMGIGLALVKGFATMHDGTVRATSEGKGKGAEFVVCLPLAAAPPPQEMRSAPPEVPSLAILIVEDNREAAETLEQLLQLEGHRTRVASDGRAGLRAFEECAPDVIISDVGLPDVSGYELVRRIRELAAGRPVFAIAMTGYARPEDLGRAREAGFDVHLPKPASLERLDELLACAAERTNRSRGAGDRSASGPSSPAASSPMST